MKIPVDQKMQDLTIDGLWTAEFGSSDGMFGGGVVVFQAGKVMGGDGTYYYIGEYKIDGSTFHATLKVSPYIEGAQSVFKTVGQDLTLELIGSLEDQLRAIAQGTALQMPGIRFAVKLTKRS
jgi:hypothetical protein